MALLFEKPQVRLSVAGVPVLGVVEVEIDAAAYGMAGSFRAIISLGFSPEFGAEYFANLTNQPVIIEVLLFSEGFETLITGRIDAIKIEWLNQTVEITGRDLTGILIDTEITESFLNQTASQIALTLASRHELVPNVTYTSSLVGQYYQLDHARASLGLNARVTTEWELLLSLALAEGFSVSVTGNNLNFGPPALMPSVLVTTGSFTSLNFDIITAIPSAAIVKSWNCRSKSVVAEIQGTGLAATIIRPNLTHDQARKLAQGHLQKLNQHQLVMQAFMPMELSLAPGLPLLMSGTGSTLDQTYIIDSVRRRLGGKSGLIQEVVAHAAASA